MTDACYANAGDAMMFSNFCRLILLRAAVILISSFLSLVMD
jgi:hypothetical protein